MELVKDTAMEVGWLVWEPRPKSPTLTVVVKATFDLPSEGIATLAAEQALVTGDEHFDDDVEQSLRWPSDLEPIKPQGECFVVGSVHPAGGQPVRQAMASYRIGEVDKTLAIFGDRSSRLGRVSEPAPFTSMELRWERCFGGRGHVENPVGRGIHSMTVDGEARLMLPNIEDPSALTQLGGGRPNAVGSFPVPRTWPARMRFAGTYDKRWLETRYPGPAEDQDYRFFLAAPPDHRIPGFWTGAEELQLRHLHPTQANVRCRLPGLRAQAFLVAREGAPLRDVGLRLDTVVVNADAGQACCIWRGVTELASADLGDVFRLFVVHQEADGRQSLADYEAWYARTLEAAAREDADDDAEASPQWPAPPDAPGAAAALASGAALGPGAKAPTAADALRAELARRRAEDDGGARGPEDEPTRGDDPAAAWAHLDQALTVRGDDSALSASLAQEVERRRELERKEAFRPVFESAFDAGFQEGAPFSVDRELSPEEILELEMASALGDLLEDGESEDRRRVREALERKESCAGWELPGVDLSRLDLTDADFRGAMLSRVNLSGAHVRGACFDGATLDECELSFAIFEEVSFVGALVSPVRAERVRFERCDLRSANLSESYLRGARFRGCVLEGAELCRSDLSGAQLESTKLDGADLSGATLDDARFVECTLLDTWLEGATAKRVVLDRCDCSLLRASEGGDFTGASFRKSRLDGARFGGAKLRGANFSLASLKRADFSDALLAQAQLTGCDLQMARLDRAVLVQASLLKCNLFQARLEGANLKHADLRGANLFQAELLGAELEDARLDLADLTGTRRA